MIRNPMLSLPAVPRTTILGLGLSTVVGWGLLAYLSQSSAEVERQLRAQVASLQKTQMQLLSERAQTQASLSDMAQLQTQLAAAQSELVRLSQSRDQDQAEQSPAQIVSGREVDVSKEAQSGVAETGSIKAMKSRKSGAVRPLTQKRGDNSRQEKGLVTTGGLDTAGLRRMTSSAEAPVP